MATERVQRKDGSWVNVVADSATELKEAVKAAKEGNPTSTININEPVMEGHDLVVVHADGSNELSDRVPSDALNFNPDVEQRFNTVDGLGGSVSNSDGAKAAAKAKAEEARLMRGPSSDAEMADAKKEADKFADKVVKDAGGDTNPTKATDEKDTKTTK